MPARIQTVPARPRVLKWAREQMRLSVDEAAAKLGISPDELRAIESEVDTTQPPKAVVRRMESVYKRTRSGLLLADPPTVRGKVEMRTSARSRPSEATLLAIRDVRRVQRFISDVLEADREVFPLPSVGHYDLTQDSEDAAEIERTRMGPSVQEQRFSWTRQAEAVGRWRETLERHGIAVTTKSMPWDECRGVAVAGDGLTPFIILNTQDTLTAMCFTMWHEYAHILLGEGSACELGAGSDAEEVERWCNRFAAAFLMPRAAIHSELMRPPFAAYRPERWDAYAIGEFAKRYKVSPMAAARRLRDVAGVSYYRDRGHELWGREHLKRRDSGGGGGELAEVRAVREYGLRVTEAVIESVQRGISDPVDAGRAVRVPASRLADLSSEIGKRS